MKHALKTTKSMTKLKYQVRIDSTSGEVFSLLEISLDQKETTRTSVAHFEAEDKPLYKIGIESLELCWHYCSELGIVVLLVLRSGDVVKILWRKR